MNDRESEVLTDLVVHAITFPTHARCGCGVVDIPLEEYHSLVDQGFVERVPTPFILRLVQVHKINPANYRHTPVLDQILNYAHQHPEEVMEYGGEKCLVGYIPTVEGLQFAFQLDFQQILTRVGITLLVSGGNPEELAERLVRRFLRSDLQ